jgi:hypothetical protein
MRGMRKLHAMPEVVAIEYGHRVLQESFGKNRSVGVNMGHAQVLANDRAAQSDGRADQFEGQVHES